MYDRACTYLPFIHAHALYSGSTDLIFGVWIFMDCPQKVLHR